MRVLIILALLGAAVAVPRNFQRIVGGEPTSIENYPYMASMHFCWFGFLCFQECGGSLITSQSVLSAAHCYDDFYINEWRVGLGSSLASSGGTVHAVADRIMHPGYSRSTLDNDIAIVHLATPAVFSDVIGVASIPGVNYNLADGTRVTAIGWGILHPDAIGTNEQLHRVDINVINHTYCVEQYAYLKSQPGYGGWPDVTDNMLCTGIQHVGGKGACSGDSGGPLVHNGNVVVGLTSWGFGCGHPDFPSVDVRVNRYVDWIVSNA